MDFRPEDTNLDNGKTKMMKQCVEAQEEQSRRAFIITQAASALRRYLRLSSLARGAAETLGQEEGHPYLQPTTYNGTKDCHSC